MILINLINGLQGALEDLFENNEFETKGNKTKKPRIVTGWYPHKNFKSYMASGNSKDAIDPDEEFPYIMISPTTQTSTNDDSTVELLFICVSHSEEQNGWMDVSLMADIIRRYLKENQIIDSFEILHDSKIEYPDEQPYPQWIAFLSAKFKVYEPINLEGGYNEK